MIELRDYQQEDFPPSQKAAKADGAKFFFTGKPCARGHISPRYVSGSCVSCKSEDREKNKERNAKYFSEWRKNNPDKVKMYHDKARDSGSGKDYYKRNRQKRIEKALAWNRANPDAAKAHCKKYRQVNRYRLSEKKRSYYRANRQDILAKGFEYRSSRRHERALATRIWRRNNPDKSSAADRNKKAMTRGAQGKHSSSDIQRILHMQNFKCAECKTSVRRNFHVDHIIPLSRGGSNWPSNIQILCPPCNLEKHASDPIEFARRRGRLV
jgi:5-methylcytosine-specific restriction endonuclease McrA